MILINQLHEVRMREVIENDIVFSQEMFRKALTRESVNLSEKAGKVSEMHCLICSIMSGEPKVSQSSGGTQLSSSCTKVGG